MLTERRKADRAEMVNQLAALAKGFGFGADLEPEPSFLGKRASIIRFSFPHGLKDRRAIGSPEQETTSGQFR